MSNVINHTHTYVKLGIRFGNRLFYKCDDPDCYHEADTNKILGKRSLCSICHQNVFILTKEDLRRARPRCPDCSKTKESIARKETKSKLEEFFTTEKLFQEPKETDNQ